MNVIRLIAMLRDGTAVFSAGPKGNGSHGLIRFIRRDALIISDTPKARSGRKLRDAWRGGIRTLPPRAAIDRLRSALADQI
jgi:hypothetical protein